MLDLEAFEEMANRLYDEIPPALLKGLNGGIIISEEAHRSDEDLPDVYIMGEYIDDPYGLGNYIILYYGSFVEVLGDEPPEVWEEELWETMLHEIRHHVELRAGVNDLDMEDLRQLEEFRRAKALGWFDAEDEYEDAGEDDEDGDEGEYEDDEPSDDVSRNGTTRRRR